MLDTRERWVLAIARHISDAIIVLDKTRTIRFANAAAAKMANHATGSELLGQSYPEILRQHKIYTEDGEPASAEAFPSEIAFRLGKETRGKIFAQIDPEGVHHWLSITSFPLSDSKGEASFVAVIFRDITRKKIHEDRLQFLLDSSKILSISTDLHTRLKEKSRLLIPKLADWATVNILTPDGALKRLAVEHRDPHKVKLVDRYAALAAEHPDENKRAIYRVAKTGVSELYAKFAAEDITPSGYSEEGRMLSKKLQPCSAMIIPIKSKSHVLGVLSLAYTEESGRHYSKDDVEFMEEFAHHLSLTIDNARLYEEIAKRDAAKDVFLATLSHELRNPLAPIKSSLELLAIKNVDEKLKPELGIIEHQFEQIEKLLRDLLDVTRLTLGKLQLERTSTDLTSLVALCIETLRGEIEGGAIDLRVLLPQEPLWVSADSVRIEQVLVNLLQNAAKFTPRGGKITVSLKKETEMPCFP
jgi:PAS domain S-box-containing protein